MAETGKAPVMLINGPNLNRLGVREPGIYGAETWHEIEARLTSIARTLGLLLDCRQSNHEGVLIDWIQEAAETADALILNAGAYTHTSIALQDALRLFSAPVIEVHLSNLAKRESFRSVSFVSPAATGVISGFGAVSYELALHAAARLIHPALDGSPDSDEPSDTSRSSPSA